MTSSLRGAAGDVAISGGDLPGYFAGRSNAYDSAINESFYKALTTRLCEAVLSSCHQPEVLLEVGCGTGFSTSVITGSFPSATVHAVEPAFDLLARARARVDNGVEWHNARLASYDGPSADTVLANMSYHWLDAADLDRLLAVTAPGGMVGITAPLRTAANHEHAGNDLLYRVFRSLKGPDQQGSAPRHWRGLNAADVAIDGLRVIDITPLSVVEELSAVQFLDVVESRGVLLSIFGDRYHEARVWLRDHLDSRGPVQLSWKLGVFLARRF